ncbi:otoferlin isoform X3 [Plutella xylostella]|uniref:otoferlin isoform X3 n=1 Tax=Plutella xylostella TaxID=51655 RepID=UPI002032469C|nr:otoferlin isoform X3 [Plutella xylostella]
MHKRSSLTRKRTQKVIQLKEQDDFLDPEAMPQYFQILVKILEGHKLAWTNPQNANSYVLVVLGKKQYRTALKKKTEEPAYKEMFTFEMFVNMRELVRSSVWLAVMELSSLYVPPRMVGEATIDLGTIWAQTDHQVLEKWVQLNATKDTTTSIPPSTLVDERKSTLDLLPSGSEQQRANYVIGIYGAYGLPNEVNQADKRSAKPPNTFVRITFCGLVVKTSTQSRTNNPVFNEQISIVEMFPNLSQTILLEVCVPGGLNNRVIASKELKLSQICHDGENGFVPTFGPCLLHLNATSCSGQTYNSGVDTPFYGGAVLMSLKTVVPYYQQSVRTTSVEAVEAVDVKTLWMLEDFSFYCPILEVSMLDKKLIGKQCGVAITVGEINSEEVPKDPDFLKAINDVRAQKLHYTKSMDITNSASECPYMDFSNGFPVLQLASRLPDFRFRMYRNNMIQRMIYDLENAIKEVEGRLEGFDYGSAKELIDIMKRTRDEIISQIMKFLDVVQFTTTDESATVLKKYSTELDEKQFAIQAEEMDKIYQNLTEQAKLGHDSSLMDTRRGAKDMLFSSKALVADMKKLIYMMPQAWSDVVVWLLSGGSRVAYYKLSPADIVYSVIPDQCGLNCGRIRTVLMKPIKCPAHPNSSTSCSCVAAKIELCMWMGLFKQRSLFNTNIPSGMKLTRLEDGHKLVLKSAGTMIECRAFIYKAKLKFDKSISNFHAFVRIYAANHYAETKARKGVAPIWDEVIKIVRMVFTSSERLLNSPPDVIVEIYASTTETKSKIELVGRFHATPVINDNIGYEDAPRLRWYDIKHDHQLKGQIQMSLQMVQVPETVIGSTVFCSNSSAVDDTNTDQIGNIESIPHYLKPVCTTYKVDVYWWGLRDVKATRKPCVVLEMDEVKIKSDAIPMEKCNCNFLNCRMSNIVEASLDDVLRSTLRVKLYDKSTFGRSVFLGYNRKNPTKFIVNWLPKTKRDSMLGPIVPQNFIQVNQLLCVRKRNQDKNNSHGQISYGSRKSSTEGLNKSKISTSSWWRMRNRHRTLDEECALLPIVKAEEKVIINQIPTFHNDWWIRFHSSKISSDDEPYRITIYKSELEAQPEFSKFKDWCSSLKLYCGKKVGRPDKDNQLYCGSVKVGIAIYSWPPPHNTLAVTPSGVELSNSFFEDYPRNDPTRFLVRCYVVRGLKLEPKDNSINPYIVISCGKKKIEDRKKYVTQSSNPIFGRSYEFRCMIPDDYRLKVSVYDFDGASNDELIGSTVIDLEDRVYTKHKARVGLPMEYRNNGPVPWRDSKKPSAILDELCRKNHLKPPEFPDSSSVIVNGVVYRDEIEYETQGSVSEELEKKENVCLSLLHNWHTLPVCGYSLVPEHVETRSLYLNPDQPGLETGKLQMWVDIYDLQSTKAPPPAVTFEDTVSTEYELRVHFDKIDDGPDTEARTPLPIAVYIKAWLGGYQENMQTTDNLHRDPTGILLLDWNMVFNFYYDHKKNEMTVENKTFGRLDDFKMVPVLYIQVFNTYNDFCPLGELTLDISRMPYPVSDAKQCELEQVDGRKLFLFSKSRPVCGWWPLQGTDVEKKLYFLAGRLQMSVCVVALETHEPGFLGSLSGTICKEVQIYKRLPTKWYIIPLLLLIAVYIFCNVYPHYAKCLINNFRHSNRIRRKIYYYQTMVLF